MRSISRFFMRAPIGLYRIRMGWLLGKRFLLLQHIGRTSGKVRETVLEVVEVSTTEAPVIVSGFGEGSQWFKNITVRPEVTVQWGRTRVAAMATRLDHNDALAVFERYRIAHPSAARVLGGKIGVSLIDDLDNAAAHLPVFSLDPQGAA